MVAVVALRLGDVIDGGVFALALVGEIVAGGLAAQFRENRSRPPEAADELAPADEEDVPLEWAGIVRPFSEDEVATLDRVLGLERPWGRAREPR